VEADLQAAEAEDRVRDHDILALERALVEAPDDPDTRRRLDAVQRRRGEACRFATCEAPECATCFRARALPFCRNEAQRRFVRGDVERWTKESFHGTTKRAESRCAFARRLEDSGVGHLADSSVFGSVELRPGPPPVEAVADMIGAAYCWFVPTRAEQRATAATTKTRRCARCARDVSLDEHAKHESRCRPGGGGR
jgi:hypothetical protein